MPESNSLILLPPRHTAQPPQDYSASKTQNPSSDDTFKQKLHNAKTQKAKKQSNETPVKAVTSKAQSTKTVLKTTADAVETKGKIPANAPKAAQNSKDQVGDPEEKDSGESEDSEKLPVLAEQAAAAVAAAKKAPSKAPKTVAAKSNQPIVDPKLTNTNPANTHKTVKDATSDDQSDSSDSKATVTALGEDESDTDSGDAEDAEFGTGKIVAGGAGHRNAGSASSADDSDSDADASESAGEAALVDAFSTTIATAVGATSAKTTAQSSVQAVGDTSTVTPLALPTFTGATGTVGKTASPTATPQAQFVEDNHSKIISSIQGKLLPSGGTLQMRLDPPGLGDLQVTVHLKDGVMTASFETSSDEATKLLSHSLGTLKSGLEAAGVTVDKIQVEQAPKKDSSGNSDGDSRQPSQDQQQQAQQDQQRREMVQRMWKKLAGGDPLDLVA